MIDMARIREGNVRRAKALKYPVNPNLPSRSPEETSLRSQVEVVHRGVALQMVLALRFGFSRDKSLAWLSENALREWFTPNETVFLDRPIDEVPEEMIYAAEAQIECQWALAWALGLSNKLSFRKYCGDNLVHLFPDFKVNESMDAFLARARPNLRPASEILEMDDLAYCLHWGIAECRMQRKRIPGKVRPYVIVERRRALSWVLGDAPWDDMPMDT